MRRVNSPLARGMQGGSLSGGLPALDLQAECRWIGTGTRPNGSVCTVFVPGRQQEVDSARAGDLLEDRRLLGEAGAPLFGREINHGLAAPAERLVVRDQLGQALGVVRAAFLARHRDARR